MSNSRKGKRRIEDYQYQPPSGADLEKFGVARQKLELILDLICDYNSLADQLSRDGFLGLYQASPRYLEITAVPVPKIMIYRYGDQGGCCDVASSGFLDGFTTRGKLLTEYADLIKDICDDDTIPARSSE